MRAVNLGLMLLAFAATTFAQDKPLKAIAVLISTSDNPKVTGNITFTQSKCGEPVYVEATIEGLHDGLHGFHIHEKGDHSNQCNSFGAHFNPDKLDHGAPGDQVRHVGDLGNINSTNNVATYKFSDHLIQLSGPKSIIGRGIVVHEKEDDLGRGGNADSLKTGNAGGRVACAVIGIAEPVDNWPCTTSGGIRAAMSLTAIIFSFMPYITSQLMR